jgi:hypothetical protein
MRAAAGVHEVAAPPGPIHRRNLPARLAAVQPLIPRPEGDGPAGLGRGGHARRPQAFCSAWLMRPVGFAVAGKTPYFTGCRRGMHSAGCGPGVAGWSGLVTAPDSAPAAVVYSNPSRRATLASPCPWYRGLAWRHYGRRRGEVASGSGSVHDMRSTDDECTHSCPRDRSTPGFEL